jgi:hypothetical protein
MNAQRVGEIDGSHTHVAKWFYIVHIIKGKLVLILITPAAAV